MKATRGWLPSPWRREEDVLANLVLYNPAVALNALQLTQLRKAILKLRWTGQEDEADRLLVRLSDCGPSEISPMGPLETD